MPGDGQGGRLTADGPQGSAIPGEHSQDIVSRSPTHCSSSPASQKKMSKNNKKTKTATTETLMIYSILFSQLL